MYDQYAYANVDSGFALDRFTLREVTPLVGTILLHRDNICMQQSLSVLPSQHHSLVGRTQKAKIYGLIVTMLDSLRQLRDWHHGLCDEVLRKYRDLRAIVETYSDLSSLQPQQRVLKGQEVYVSPAHTVARAFKVIFIPQIRAQA